MQTYELNMDGLVGPTHHYAGLGIGNLASETNALSLANPQAAALQGLAKMRFLLRLGLQQAILPPHQRPNLALLHQLGFHGKAKQQINQAYRQAPALLSACYSASSMWTANAATVSASSDSGDQRVHFTAANLISNLHRSQEADFSKTVLERIFSKPDFFTHHPPLPKSLVTSDEGAANHNRLCAHHGSAGLNLFVYGRQALAETDPTRSMAQPNKYPARQTLEASMAIARAHQLDNQRVVFAKQTPTVIDQGVFHNDVIGVANENLLLIHQHAFVDQHSVYEELKHKADFDLSIIEVNDKQVSVAEAVGSYLFNSQLLTLPNRSMVLVAPIESQQSPAVNTFIEQLIADSSNPVNQVYFLDVKQSMRNGGGPACLRLRVPLKETELAAMHQQVLVDEALLDRLEVWVKKHYRQELQARDLADPALLEESFTALDELSQLLQLGSLYPFQQEQTA